MSAERPDRPKTPAAVRIGDYCGCARTCGDDGDIDGPGVCKGLPVCRPPIVEVVLVDRHRSV